MAKVLKPKKGKEETVTLQIELTQSQLALIQKNRADIEDKINGIGNFLFMEKGATYPESLQIRQALISAITIEQ